MAGIIVRTQHVAWSQAPPGHGFVRKLGTSLSVEGQGYGTVSLSPPFQHPFSGGKHTNAWTGGKEDEGNRNSNKKNDVRMTRKKRYTKKCVKLKWKGDVEGKKGRNTRRGRARWPNQQKCTTNRAKSRQATVAAAIVRAYAAASARLAHKRGLVDPATVALARPRLRVVAIQVVARLSYADANDCQHKSTKHRCSRKLKKKTEDVGTNLTLRGI